MQLITISGFPCSGKTFRSNQLVEYLQSRISESKDPRISKITVHHINEESLGVSRNVYNTARLEKDARATEMSAVKRFLTRDAIVIADGLNYIKGYRYQLHCEAKAAQTPSCVV
jgi:protein KTI12